MARKLLNRMKRAAQTPAVDTSHWALPREEADAQRDTQAKIDEEIIDKEAGERRTAEHAERAKHAVAKKE